MTEEDEEFQRLEREAKMRRMAEEDDDTQVYKKPWVGLTEEEIEATWSQLWKNINQMKVASEDRPTQETVRRLFARALETKLKGKNT